MLYQGQPHTHSRTQELVCRSGTHGNRIKWNLHQSLLKTDSSTSQATASIAGSAFSMCRQLPTQKASQICLVTLNCSLLFFGTFESLLARRIKVLEQKIAFFYIQTDKIGPSVETSFEHLIKTHPRNPTFCRDVPKLSSSSRIF